ncbi:UDP-N-acetylmuramoyl-tripeptide--D-alanyl-D-alanine ligase [Mycoplasmatota bacterium WC44]
MDYILILISIFLVYRMYDSVYKLQLNGYHKGDYFKWILKTFEKYNEVILYLTLPFLMFSNYLLVQVMIALYLVYIFISKKRSRRMLRLTPRIGRLLVVNLIVTLILILTLTYFKVSLFNTLYLCAVFNYIITFTSNLVLTPFEKHVHMKYRSDAVNKLNKIDVDVIGVTGSYGKTTTKEFIYTMLCNYYKVRKTPKSFNTPMGVCRVINDNLRSSDEVFVVEMGAKRIGEIQKVCNIVNPKYGVLTWIGNQHLETFESIENIVKTKFELIESLPEDGIGFINTDCKRVKEYKIKNKCKIVTFGIENAEYTARNIVYTDQGMKLDIYHHEELFISLNTKIVGKYNMYNLLSAVVISKELGLTANQVQVMALALTTVKNRLELKRNGRLTIIDDTYNSNPLGFEMALDVLEKMDGDKYLITPGMVELGKESEAEHKNLAKLIDETCDVIILTSENAKYLGKYLTSNNLFAVETISEAMKLFNRIYDGKRATLLLENDLPDNY